MRESKVIISLYSPLLINEFLLLSSPVNVGQIDRNTLNTDVMSSLSLLAYSCYLFNLYLHLTSLVLEAHCFNSLHSDSPPRTLLWTRVGYNESQR